VFGQFIVTDCWSVSIAFRPQTSKVAAEDGHLSLREDDSHHPTAKLSSRLFEIPFFRQAALLCRLYLGSRQKTEE